jgi:hypothetical protein
VLGINTNTGSTSGNGDGAGVFGQTSVSGGAAVVGMPTGNTFANGVAGFSANSGTAGVYGKNVSGGYAIYGDNGNSNTNGWAGFFSGQVLISGNLTVQGNCNGSTCSSDMRLKKNIQSLEGSLDTLAKLRPVSFEWRDPDRGSGAYYGFIAQEVEKVKPEWVGVDAKGFKTVDYTKYPIMLVDAVRTLKEQNDDLRARESKLEDRVRSLEAGRRPLISGMGEGGVGLGMLALAGAFVFTKRKRSE